MTDGYCNNDKRHPERMIVHHNVKDEILVFHRLLLSVERQKAWMHVISKEREDFESVALHFQSVAL